MRPPGRTSGLGSGALTRIAGGVQTTFADPSNLPSLLLAVAAPDLLDPKSAAQNSKPRLSFSTKPTVLASRVESDTTINVMKWKTVSTIFLVVVLYLIIGATVFKALEQPHEISQRTTIVIQKQTFISQHACVNSTELDELIQEEAVTQPSALHVPVGSSSTFLPSLDVFGHRFLFLLLLKTICESSTEQLLPHVMFGFLHHLRFWCLFSTFKCRGCLLFIWVAIDFSAMDMGLSKFWEMAKVREAWRAAVHGVAKSWTPLMMPSSHLVPCHPLLLLPSIFPSIRVFCNELVLCIKWPKYWRFSFSINPFNE
ncbi:hypothetical protein FD755_011260 [Muntiacus reevesi]|uniref:Potassium channel subfamily K member 2 n=1 Tax=Muntiacus reevesi TaxID=9886 RepID=A0A5N3XUE3_MUNRE|nr:hypothetical protein FD755_011260 [Muntiacus reevesi]